VEEIKEPAREQVKEASTELANTENLIESCLKHDERYTSWRGKGDGRQFEAQGNIIFPDKMGNIGDNMEVLSKRVKLTMKDPSGQFRLAK